MKAIKNKYLYICINSFLLIFFLFIGLNFNQVQAADQGIFDQTINGAANFDIKFKPNVTIPGSDQFKKGADHVISANSAGLYINDIYKFFTGIASILAVFMMSLGGFWWLTSGGNASRISTAKEWIEGAIIGLVLVLGSYLLLQIINPNLVKTSLGIKKVIVWSQGECFINPAITKCSPPNLTCSSGSNCLRLPSPDGDKESDLYKCSTGAKDQCCLTDNNCSSQSCNLDNHKCY